MKVTVDPSLCTLNAECTLAAPDVFRIGNGELSYVEHPDESERSAVEDAVASCPNQAISIVDE